MTFRFSPAENFIIKFSMKWRQKRKQKTPPKNFNLWKLNFNKEKKRKIHHHNLCIQVSIVYLPNIPTSRLFAERTLAFQKTYTSTRITFSIQTFLNHFYYSWMIGCRSVFLCQQKSYDDNILIRNVWLRKHPKFIENCSEIDWIFGQKSVVKSSNRTRNFKTQTEFYDNRTRS